MADDPDRLAHARVGSYFLGPKAENFQILSDIFSHVLNDQRKARQQYMPDDPAFITAEMIQTEGFQESVQELQEYVSELSATLAATSIPFWSPRYNGHMNMDTSLASIVGYMTTMMYNPNNVATEASPYTTKLEREVGEDLCEMLGYESRSGVQPWGHVTCDGSVANLEAIWSIRNLKFYPLSLKLAITKNPKLSFLRTVDPPFAVKTCKGETKPFLELSVWELLNLRPATILELPTRLGDEYSITPAFLQTALKDYLIQTVSKDALEKEFGVKPGNFFVSATKHYSWPKGGAISGIGSGNFIDVDVDEDARMDVCDLRVKLQKCLDEETPVFGVVAIIGSTEHGACDPVKAIAEMREEFQASGLSFAIHCDAAWGGYFASTLRSVERGPMLPGPLVPSLQLQEHTQEQLRNLKHAESITIDPHKSGYINYPAGGLCYRDGRMRYLVTWTSPIVFHQGDEGESMGVYGVEGSKPGASAAATWLTHRTLGIHKEGYGRLLGEAVFTCTKLYCYWATMTGKDGGDDLIVVPLVRLPSEKAGGSKEDVEAEKERIREKILGVKNEVLVKDKETWKFLEKLGGDLMINAFGCNFKFARKQGEPKVANTDVGEANYLNQRIFSRLSVTSTEDKIQERPLFLTSSVFEEEAYGRCLSTYKTRLQLDDGATPARGDLRFLVNVTMSPWPTDSPFLEGLAASFRQIAQEEVERAQKRNTLTPDIHGFVVQGSADKIFAVHIPMFHMANHRWQLVISAELPDEIRDRYRKLRDGNPGKFYTIANLTPAYLEDLTSPPGHAEAEWRMDEGIPSDPEHDPPLFTFKLKNVKVVVKESMSYAALETSYPDRMPFYLYGACGEVHIDHLLRTAPNAQICGDKVELDLGETKLTDDQLGSGALVVVFEDVFEGSVQPLPLDEKTKKIRLEAPGLRLVPGAKHKVSVYESYNAFKGGEDKPIAKGSLTVGKSGVFADWQDVNMDFPPPPKRGDDGKAAHQHAKMALSESDEIKFFGMGKDGVCKVTLG